LESAKTPVMGFVMYRKQDKSQLTMEELYLPFGAA
jgi:hypothetical protein